MPDTIPTSLLKYAREQAGISQSQLAEAIGVSGSVVSRLEGTDETDGTLAKRYLNALGTALSADIIAYFHEDWRHVPRAPFHHPDRALFRLAERALVLLEEFEKSRKYNTILADPIAQLRSRIAFEADFLLSVDHTIGFVGAIGVGKTTALSRICNLVAPGGSQSIFPTGSGRTTVCEVVIQGAPTFGISVDSLSNDEVQRLVTDLVNGVASGKGGLPSELDRLIRNMADVRRTSRKSENPGKIVTIDNLRELIDKTSNTENVISELITRINLDSRNKTQTILPDDDNSGISWLSENISKINYGQHPAFSVPQRITVLIPYNLLNTSPYRIRIIDTKGVEGTTQRSDLSVLRDDPRTLTVLCSKFADAPGSVALSFMKDAIDAGSDALASNRMVVLVLPREDEAFQIVDDAGVRAQSAQEGYAIREAQIIQQFSTDQLPYVDTNFFQVGLENSATIWSWLVDEIDGLRGRRTTSLQSLIDGAHALVKDSNAEKTRQARRVIKETLGAAIKRQKLESSVRPAHSTLIAEAKKTHHSSIAASVIRRGEWDAFSVPHILGAGLRADSNLRTRDNFVRLSENIESLKERHRGIKDVRQFLDSIQFSLDEWKRDFLARSEVIGRVSYSSYLTQANDLWQECQDRYGLGGGYRIDVSDIFETHFENDAGAKLARENAETSLEAAWKDIVIKPLVKALEFGDE